MNAIKTCLVISGLAILGAAGCAQPGVIETHPAEPVAKDAGTKPKKDAKVDVDTDEGPATGTDDEPADESADEPADEPGDEPTDGTPKPVDAGKKPDASDSKADAGTKTDAGGTTTKPDEGGACPADYMCQDSAKSIADMGLMGTITDPDGKPVMYSCAKGGQEMCDQKDPKKSCPNFPNAFCMHVKLTGLISADIYQCGQKCTP